MSFSNKLSFIPTFGVTTLTAFCYVNCFSYTFYYVFTILSKMFSRYKFPIFCSHVEKLTLYDLYLIFMFCCVESHFKLLMGKNLSST